MDLIFLALFTLCNIVIFAILSAVYNQYAIRQKLKNIPDAGGYPFVGLAFKFMNLSEYERTKWYLTCLETYKEGIFIIRIGGIHFVNIFKPEYLELIFPSTVNISKAIFYNIFKPCLGNGLVTSTGKQWFHDRKLIEPTFHFSMLNQFALIKFEKAEILIKCLERKIKKGKPIDIYPLALNVALDIICETIMGVDIHAQEVTTKYTSAVQQATSSITNRNLRPWYLIDWLYYLLPAGKQFKSAVDIMNKFSKEIINKRKAERQSQNDDTELEDKDNEFDIGKRKRQVFLDLLLDQNAKDDTPLTVDELKAQVNTFLIAGHHTIALAITWALFLLGNNLEHQERVHKELEEIFGDSEAPATVKELSQLKYLDRVIKETLRILPTVPIISRQLSEEVKLDNYRLPKGTQIAIPIALIHRNPAVWPNPMKFDPDRFLPENLKNRSPYAYVPFSAGPRNCIGQRFAQLEGKIVLTAILRKWKVKSVKTFDTIEYSGLFLLQPSEEILINFTPKE